MGRAVPLLVKGLSVSAWTVAKPMLFLVMIPLVAGMRSLNVAVAAGIALGEALRQTKGWPA